MGSGYSLWDLHAQRSQNYKDGMLDDISSNFNMAHGVTYVKANKFGYKVFSFSTEHENTKMHSKIISNLPLFQKFLDYLDKNLNPIRNRLYDKKVSGKDLIGDSFTSQSGIVIPVDYSSKKDNFLSSIDVNYSNIQKVSVSAKEALCLDYLRQCLTAKAIANNLCISYRTVEKHIENLKKKFGVKTKKQLIDASVRAIT